MTLRVGKVGLQLHDMINKLSTSDISTKAKLHWLCVHAYAWTSTGCFHTTMRVTYANYKHMQITLLAIVNCITKLPCLAIWHFGGWCHGRTWWLHKVLESTETHLLGNLVMLFYSLEYARDYKHLRNLLHDSYACGQYLSKTGKRRNYLPKISNTWFLKLAEESWGIFSGISWMF